MLNVLEVLDIETFVIVNWYRLVLVLFDVFYSNLEQNKDGMLAVVEVLVAESLLLFFVPICFCFTCRYFFGGTHISKYKLRIYFFLDVEWLLVIFNC